MLAQAEEVEVETPSKGRRRKPWQVVAVVDVPESESLRVAGQKWLSSQKILHKTLTNSSHNGKATLIARCLACQDCSYQHCFSWTEDNKLQVEAVGQHTENKNTAVLKRAHAKAFAQHSPSKAGE